VTQFHQDLVKIGVDKGLLALVAVIFGYFLSRGLEKYKARNIYFQNVAERKLDGLEKLALMLQKHVFRILYLVTLLEHGPDNDRLIWLKKMKDTYAKLAAMLDEDTPELRQCVTMYADPAFEFFAKHQDLINEFGRAIQDAEEPLESSAPRIRDVANRILRNFTEIQFALREEMTKPPF